MAWSSGRPWVARPAVVRVRLPALLYAPFPLLALLLLAIACAQPGDDTTLSPHTTPTTANAAPPATESPPSPVGSPMPATVTNVVDGDTIDALIDGREYRVRYIGIDTPETVDPRRPVGCFGHEASERNRELVQGQTIGLQKDVSETDAFGRLLRYVWLDGQMVNARLVEEGYATASAFPPDVTYSELFTALQAEARADGRGLWSACVTPTPGSACDQPLIKGNISGGGEKVYHVPGGASYGATVIDETKGERWFCTEAEAVAAGWRKSAR